MASIWGGDSPSVAWGDNSWQSNTVSISLTAPSASTSSVGSITAFNQNGWGGAQWGNDGWGVNFAVALTAPAGLSTSLGSLIAEQFIDAPLTAPTNLTSSLGSLTTTQLSIADLTAPSQMTSQVGDFDNAGTLVGWGRNGWGEEPYGDSFNKLVQPAGLSTTSSVGSLTALPEELKGVIQNKILFINGCHQYALSVVSRCPYGVWDSSGTYPDGTKGAEWTLSIWISDRAFTAGEQRDVLIHESAHALSYLTRNCNTENNTSFRKDAWDYFGSEEQFADALVLYFGGSYNHYRISGDLTNEETNYISNYIGTCSEG